MFLTNKEGKVSAKFCQSCPAIGLPYLDSASRRVRYYAKFAISNYVIKLEFIDYKRGKEVDKIFLSKFSLKLSILSENQLAVFDISQTA